MILSPTPLKRVPPCYRTLTTPTWRTPPTNPASRQQLPPACKAWCRPSERIRHLSTFVKSVRSNAAASSPMTSMSWARSIWIRQVAAAAAMGTNLLLSNHQSPPTFTVKSVEFTPRTRMASTCTLKEKITRKKQLDNNTEGNPVPENVETTKTFSF